MSKSGRETVSFITVESGKDLIVAYAIAADISGKIVSLILQRTPMYEHLLPPEDRGATVSHEAFPEDGPDLLKRVVLDGTDTDIETTRRAYRIDLSGADPEEVMDAQTVLRQMHSYGGFELHVR
jgi:hypothetical protein